MWQSAPRPFGFAPERRSVAREPLGSWCIGTVCRVDWFLFHAINTGVATRDWLEDPVTLLAGPAVACYALATVALWFLDRPYRELKWKLACASALLAAGLAMVVNQAVAQVWDRPRPYASHGSADHLLSAPSTDPSFPSDHAAAAFAIAFAVLGYSRRVGIAYLAAATLIGISRIAVGMHYPSDVIAGALVGFIAAVLVTGAGRRPTTRVIVLASRVSDPALQSVWQRIPRRGVAFK